MKLSKEARELMKQAEDFQAREEACKELHEIIAKSRRGNISIDNFIEEVAEVNKELKKSLNLWAENL